MPTPAEAAVLSSGASGEQASRLQSSVANAAASLKKQHPTRVAVLSTADAVPSAAVLWAAFEDLS